MVVASSLGQSAETHLRSPFLGCLSFCRCLYPSVLLLDDRSHFLESRSVARGDLRQLLLGGTQLRARSRRSGQHRRWAVCLRFAHIGALRRSAACVRYSRCPSLCSLDLLTHLQVGDRSADGFDSAWQRFERRIPLADPHQIEGLSLPKVEVLLREGHPTPGRAGRLAVL